MNGHKEPGIATCSESDDAAARVIAYFGPYLFWGLIGIMIGGIVLLG